MKLKIKVKRLNKNISLPEVTKKGDWIDLRSSETLSLTAPQASVLKRHKLAGMEINHRDVSFDYSAIPLGVAIKLPSGFEAVVASRSGTPSKFGIIVANSIGVIDQPYCGNKDEWKCPVLAIRDTVIHEGDRICQFRIQLSQKATFWQKLMWLISSGVEIVEVDSLSDTNRGMNVTGVK